MGEIAELMLNGDICEGCGEELPGSGPGFPRYCRACPDPGDGSAAGAAPAKDKKHACPICQRVFHSAKSVEHHRAAVHWKRDGRVDRVNLGVMSEENKMLIAELGAVKKKLRERTARLGSEIGFKPAKGETDDEFFDRCISRVSYLNPALDIDF